MKTASGDALKAHRFSDFQAAVASIVISRGGCAQERWYGLLIDTPAGILEVSACESAVTRGAGKAAHWVACRFPDVERAILHAPGVNPFSGKWNFHGNTAQEALEAFEAGFARLLATPAASGVCGPPVTSQAPPEQPRPGPNGPATSPI